MINSTVKIIADFASCMEINLFVFRGQRNLFGDQFHLFGDQNNLFGDQINPLRAHKIIPQEKNGYQQSTKPAVSHNQSINYKRAHHSIWYMYKFR